MWLDFDKSRRGHFCLKESKVRGPMPIFSLFLNFCKQKIARKGGIIVHTLKVLTSRALGGGGGISIKCL